MAFWHHFIVQCLVMCSLYLSCPQIKAEDFLGCGGFVKSDVEINFSRVEVCLFCHHDHPPGSIFFLNYVHGRFVMELNAKSCVQ